MFKFPFFKKKAKERTEEKPVYVLEENLSANSLANKAYGIIERLAAIGPRPSASKESRMAASNIMGLLDSHCDEVSLLEFSADRKRGSLWTRILSLLLPLSSLFLLSGLPYLSFIVNILSFLLIYYEALLAKGLFSRFSKKERGVNLRAVINPKDEEDKVVVLSCHHDSALLYRRKDHIRDIYLPICTLAYSSVLSVFLMLHEALRGELLRFNIPSLFPLVFIIISAILSILSLRLYSLFSSSYSPGVGDNLSGVGIASVLAEYFSKRRLERTRIDVVSFDAEECGNQGSRDYYSKVSYPEGTININIDGIYDSEGLAVLSNDGNGLKKLDSSLAVELSALAKSMGYKVREGRLSLFSGATDALSASERGLRAVTITGMASSEGSYAHTSEDCIDKVDVKSLEEVIALIIKFIESGDKRGTERKEEEESLLLGKKYRLSLCD